MPPATVIFDLDGTLVDSAAEIGKAMAGAWNEIFPGRPFPRQMLRIGPPLMEAIAALDPDPGRHEALAAAFRRRYDASDFSQTLPYPGMDALLDSLSSRGVSCGLATNKRRAPTLAIVARWFPDRFDRIACSDGVWPDDGTTHLKSKAAMFEWLGRARPPSGRAVMVGDAASDIAAARASGLRAVAVTWGYDDAQTLVAAAPDALVHEVGSLLAALDLPS
jgi:phosphoglycolate phosphatase-like HAD superfamily hydrolase